MSCFNMNVTYKVSRGCGGVRGTYLLRKSSCTLCLDSRKRPTATQDAGTIVRAVLRMVLLLLDMMTLVQKEGFYRPLTIFEPFYYKKKAVEFTGFPTVNSMLLLMICWTLVHCA